MKELFLTKITKPPEVIVNKFLFLCVCSFFLFPCSKGQAVRAYLDMYCINDLNCGVDKEREYISIYVQYTAVDYRTT